MAGLQLVEKPVLESIVSFCKIIDLIDRCNLQQKMGFQRE